MNVRFFQKFPSMLERFGDILEFIDFPSEKPDRRSFSEIARGEVLLHLYVEETTQRLFGAEKAILLQASAEAYDVKPLPSYDVEAVNRGRYWRWFRANKASEYRELKRLVRGIKHDGARFLANFLEAQMMTASLGLYASKEIMESMREPGDRSSRPKIRIGDPLVTIMHPPRFRRFSSRTRDPKLPRK
jgi:hypothetical protein